MKKRLSRDLIIVYALSAAVMLGACGSASSSMRYQDAAMESADYAMKASGSTNANDAYESYPEAGVYEEAAMDMADASSAGQAETPDVKDQSRKLITTVNLTAETEDLDTTLQAIESKVKQLGGYIESSNIYNGTRSNYTSRNADLTVRVPAKNLDEFINLVEGANNITRKSVYVEDVTLTYVDIESKKNSLKTEEKRLLDIMESAETVEDLITVEDKLANVRYELESIESRLRSYDNQVDYSTVYLNIQEVAVYTPVQKAGPFKRMGDGFVQSLKDVGEAIVEFLVWLVSHIPQLILILILIGIIAFIVRLIIKKAKKRREKKMEQLKAQYEAAKMQNTAANVHNTSANMQNAAPNVPNTADNTQNTNGNDGNKQ